MGINKKNRRKNEFLFEIIDEILKKLKSGYDLSSEEKKELEELIDNLI